MALGALSLTLLLFPAAPASAAILTDRPLEFSFDGADTSAGHLVQPFRIAIDNSNGSVYVSEGTGGFISANNEAVCKFDADGTAANFPATGDSCLDRTPSGYFDDDAGVVVDNSGGLGGPGEGEQGRIYVVERSNQRLSAFDPSGAFLWELEISLSPEDVAVDTAGHPWVLFGNESVREYSSTGAEKPLDSCTVSGSNALDIDADGNVYVASITGVRKYVGCTFDSILDPNSSRDVFADQSTPSGHIFTYRRPLNELCEYDASGAPVGCFDKDRTPGGFGIAYSDYDPDEAGPEPSFDRAYVAGQGLGEVDALGPQAMGTVPDATTEPPTIEGPGTATLHGTVNPQGVASAYYFEWSDRPFVSNEGHVFRSPEQSLPEDSSPHPVSFKARSLRGEPSEWRVRLVGINTANGLRQASNTTTFETPKATEPPEVTINDPSAITPESAHISGTVNPKEDSAVVGVFSDPGCTTGSFKTREIYLPGGQVNTPVPVELDLKKLTPGAHYCVFLAANNSFGAPAESEIKQFDTPPPPPSEVSTAFAAPRTDTTARINGRVNPGSDEDFKYRFEWSEDGSTWTQLPLRESNIDAKEQVVVADELTGLQPGATYHYRLAYAENKVGPATTSGAEKIFTTHARAEVEEAESLPGCTNEDVRAAQHTEYLGSCRGIELVNSPDKGNQNVLMPLSPVPFLSPDGERARWSVSAGAPDSPNGILGQLLAERTRPTATAPTGWQSRSLAPPASRQLRGGNVEYELEAGSPGFSRLIANVHIPELFTFPREANIVRLNDQQNEEVLAEYTWSAQEDEFTGLDATEDGSHVLLVEPAPPPRQLVDIGSGVEEIVSLLPPPGWPLGAPYEGGTPSECGLKAGTSFAGGGGSTGGTAVLNQWRPGYHMIDTTDASLVYFEAKPDGECGKPWGLYVRDREAETTTPIDPGFENSGVEFIRATPDGRYGYFATKSELDPADGNTAGVDLYRWDQEAGESTCLTCEANPNAAIKQSAPVMVSDDFSHAYFESTRQLVQGLGVRGKANVYVLSGGAIRFVGTAGGVLDQTKAKLSADGNVLTFRSNGLPALTADEVDCGGGACEQLYLYDDRDGSVECLSCEWGDVTTQGFGSHQLSADGSTVGFATQEALVPRDVNRDTDLYEWRNGSRHLLTDGVSDPPTEFAAPGVRGIDADGSDILFSVVAPGLTGFEQDSLANLYDARIGGGFLPQAEPVCEGDDCQGRLATPPALDQPTSSDASRGNVPGTGCPKDKVRRHGRCVRPRCARGKVRRHGRCVRPKNKRQHRRRAANAKRGRNQ